MTVPIHGSEPSSVLVLQHVAAERPGLIGEAFSRRGSRLRVVRTWLGEPIPEGLAGAQALVVMGGPMGVYEEQVFPHLREEARLIERALSAGVPVLGVCLGSQLLASVLGSRVGPGARKEIGWYRVDLSEAARTDPLFESLPRSYVSLHWHGDVFDLPKGAVSLARSALTDCQAFRYGAHAYGILFHMELTAEMLAEWITTFASELESEGISGASIAAEGERLLAELAPLGCTVFERFASLAAGASSG